MEVSLNDRQSGFVIGILKRGAKELVLASDGHPEAIKDAAKIIELETSLSEVAQKSDPV